MCDYCKLGRAIVFCKTHLARLCVHCDWTLHNVNVNSPDHSRFLLCNNCVSQTAFVQFLEQGFCLCQTCVSNANVTSRFLLCNASVNKNSGYSCPPDLLDLDSSCSSSSFSFIDWGLPIVSLPPNNGDLSSSSKFSQKFDNHTKNSSDQQVQMLQPNYLNIPKVYILIVKLGGILLYLMVKMRSYFEWMVLVCHFTQDSSCSGFNVFYDNKEQIVNGLMNNYGVGEAVVEDLILTDRRFLDELMKYDAETTTEVYINKHQFKPVAYILMFFFSYG